MTTHTSGPWKRGKYIITTVDGGFVAHTRPTSVYRVSDEANAQLIAAAPDLLAACQSFMTYKTVAELDVVVGLISEAIAKATKGSA